MGWKPNYLTVAQLCAYLRISDSDDDTELGVAIAAASRAIDKHCGRQFGKVDAPEERFYTPVYDRRRGRWLAVIDDLMSTVDVTVEVAGSALTGYTLEPRNAAAKGRPWEVLVVDTDSTVQPTGDEYELAMTAPWGWTAAPEPVELACYLQASRFHARRGSPYGVAGSPDLGNELRLLAKLDPDVAVSLGSYMRWWASA
jgi:hypothetical protein